MDTTGYRWGLIFLLSLAFVGNLVFAWCNWHELRLKRVIGMKLLTFIPNVIAITLFLTGAAYTAYYFVGWAGRGFMVALP